MDFREIDKKWQKKWEESKIFEVKEDPKKKKYYVLEMFPYPSGEGLHMGHAFNYIIGDIYTRFKRMKGFNVLHPMGYDSLGLPAENAAIKTGIHPKTYTENAIKNFMKQQKSLGLSYDWSRVVMTHDPSYYKWDQWIFLKMLEKGIAFRKKAPVNWCPKCKTVLANEQVVDGKCWRCKTDVEIKHLEQWFFKITDYAEELYRDIDKLEGWPEDVKTMQKNWIGRSEGTEVHFQIDGTEDFIKIFTTRVDTIYGVTFLVFAPEHPKVMELVKGTEYEEKVKEFVRKVVIEEKFERTSEEAEKKGMFIGKYAINPLTGERVPIYIGNFVLLDYGSGAVMAVPAHDQRDFEFAKKYNIPIKVVIQPEGKNIKADEMEHAYEGDGILVNSGQFTGMKNREAIKKITEYLEEIGKGGFSVQYKLRDWLISRQRYWGTPIPVVYCEKCGVVPVPEDELPVSLPEDVKFGEGNPLETNKEFVNTKCPKCGGPARRETDTMDTFVNSSWYFLRYCDPKNEKHIFDKDKAMYWTPIDMYIGGKEHACMHLIYFRFYTKFLRDLGLIDIDEPALNLFNQGMVHDEQGRVMSKSLGNVIDPLSITEKYGTDSLRLFLVSVASPDKDFNWSSRGVESSHKFLKKFYEIAVSKHESFYNTRDKYVLAKLNAMLKNFERRINELEYNLAIKELFEFISYIRKYSDYISPSVWKECIEKTCLILSPIAPHICEEIWEKLGHDNFIILEKWPEYDPEWIKPELEAEDELISRVISDINEIKKLANIEKPSKITIFVSEPWKYKVYNYVLQNKELKEIMSDPEIKKYGKRVVSYYQKLQKKKPLNELFLTAGSEIEALRISKDFIEKEFNCKVEIIKAEDSDIPKAKSAEPGKPGILVS